MEEKVYFTSNAEYRHPGQVYLSGVGSGRDTIEEARVALADHIKYYHGIGCQIVKAHIERVCETCNGTGEVNYGKRVKRWKRCPDCKGKDSRVIVETWIDLPKDAWID